MANEITAYNKGFSAMLASQHILIDISLISCSPSFTNITGLGNIPSAFYLYPATVPAEVTQNITAESTGRWPQLKTTTQKVQKVDKILYPINIYRW